MNEIASKILSVILSAVASGAISGVAVWLRMRKKKDNAVADGVQCLLREKIIEKHAKYVEEKHYCPIYAKDPSARRTPPITPWAAMTWPRRCTRK